MLKALAKTLAATIILALTIVLLPKPAVAGFTPLQGQFTATNTCPALASIRKNTNPGDIEITPGQTYPVLAQNDENASHYQIEIAGASPTQRWVTVNCGTIDATIIPASASEITTVPMQSATGTTYLLALSWQPNFCEGKPDKTECKNLAENPNRPEATHFVLHGLWPQPQGNDYCGVSSSDRALDEGKAWSKLPAIEEKLAPATWAKLQAVMPGTVSNLHRHEWIKHGTCYQGTPEEYFSEAIALLEQINQSPVQVLIAQKIGQQLPVKDIDEKLIVFGADTGNKVEVKCNATGLTEMWFNLEGEITPTTPISKLLVAAQPAKPEKYPACLIDDARD